MQDYKRMKSIGLWLKKKRGETTRATVLQPIILLRLDFRRHFLTARATVLQPIILLRLDFRRHFLLCMSRLENRAEISSEVSSQQNYRSQV